MYSRDKIISTMKDIYEESKEIKPYVCIAQPRRDLRETPAQNLDGYEGIHLNLDGFSHGFCNIGGESVDVARNYLIEQAIESGAKYMLFVGEDTVLPFNAFMKLHETAEKNPNSMVVGVYYVKLSIPMIMIKKDGFIVPADVTPGQVFEAWQTGLDAALIPTSILKAMKEQDPELPFCCIGHKLKDENGEDIPFIGEDNFFVYRLRKMGYKLLVNTDVQCLHCDIKEGFYTCYEGLTEDYIRQNFFTNIPMTRRMTMADKEYIDKRWFTRLPGNKKSLSEKIEYLKSLNNPVKLNMGSGECILEGYINIDSTHKDADVICDVFDIQVEDETIDEIVALHLLEHINPYKVFDLLKMWKNMLKPNGKLVMEMPDLEAMCKAFGEASEEKRNELILCIYGANNCSGVGVPSNIDSPHLWGYYPKLITDILNMVGFKNIKISDEQSTRPGINFRVEATK